jgi:tripartite-type tricarboxylate transporter receptor subunit TctC
LTLAAPGPASIQQMAFEMLKRAAKVDMTLVPYPGGASPVNALLGEHVTSVLISYSTVSEQLKASKLRALATASRTRIEALPEVPTVAESGYKDFDAENWFGLFSPAKTLKATISQLASWFSDALQAPEVKAKLGSRDSIRSGCAARLLVLLFANNMTTSAASSARQTSRRSEQAEIRQKEERTG